MRILDRVALFLRTKHEHVYVWDASIAKDVCRCGLRRSGNYFITYEQMQDCMKLAIRADFHAGEQH